MPIVCKIPPLAKVLGLPYVPVTANMLAVRSRSGSIAYFPAKFKLRVLDPVHFDVPPDQERYSKQPDHGRVREHPRADPGRALRHAAHPPVGLVRLMGR